MLRYLIIIIIFSGLLAGCGMSDANNPIGVLGGGNGGYGEGGGNSTTQNSIIGKWRSDMESNMYMIFEFKNNNVFIYSVYQNGVLEMQDTGTYSISGSYLTLNIMSSSYVYSFSIDGDMLYIYSEIQNIVFYRVS